MLRSQQKLLPTYLIPGCVGRGVGLRSESSSGCACAGIVWKFGNMGTWKICELKIRAKFKTKVGSDQNVGKSSICNRSGVREILGEMECLSCCTLLRCSATFRPVESISLADIAPHLQGQWAASTTLQRFEHLRQHTHNSHRSRLPTCIRASLSALISRERVYLVFKNKLKHCSNCNITHAASWLM